MGIVNGSRVDSEQQLDNEQKVKLKCPSKYEVYLINDDYTPMDFVVAVLQKIFGMAFPQAVKVMLDVHHHGSGVCGVYTKDVAETKVAQVAQFARQNEHPLLCQMRKV